MTHFRGFKKKDLLKLVKELTEEGEFERAKREKEDYAEMREREICH